MDNIATKEMITSQVVFGTALPTQNFAFSVPNSGEFGYDFPDLLPNSGEFGYEFPDDTV